MKYTPSPSLSEAAAYLSSASSLAKVSNTTKLELYGLYKYLTVAPVPQNPRPSLFDLTGRAKWDAWSNTGKVYADNGSDAERRYLDLARGLGWVPGAAVSVPQNEGEVWDEDLGVSISLSSTQGKGGMGGSVSVMTASRDEGNTGGHILHAFAIQGNVIKISQFLAENSLVDVNGRDEYGYTALHLACDRGSLPVVQVLIKHGADVTIKDPDDLTGMELAHVAGHDEICAFLRTRLH
ncbi:ankyrin repeat-containing domain protein [Boletus edulis]|nr:ankyrin repeat-containing domain protein [Boletus edulis]